MGGLHLNQMHSCLKLNSSTNMISKEFSDQIVGVFDNRVVPKCLKN